MKVETYIDTHQIWLNSTTTVSSRYVPCTLTGRIKYLDYGKPHVVELMVEATYESIRFLPKERWWKKKKLEVYDVTKWVKEGDIEIEIIPEETIYGCAPESNSD